MMQQSSLPSPEPARAEWSDQDLLTAVAVTATAIIWPVGLLLAWASRRWRLVDKLVATVLPVAGLVASLVVLPAGERGFGLSAPSSLGSGLAILHYGTLVGAPLLAALYLGIRGGLSRRLLALLLAIALVVLALGQLAFFLGARLQPGGM
jgi:hypothetical protein